MRDRIARLQADNKELALRIGATRHLLWQSQARSGQLYYGVQDPSVKSAFRPHQNVIHCAFSQVRRGGKQRENAVFSSDG